MFLRSSRPGDGLVLRRQIEAILLLARSVRRLHSRSVSERRDSAVSARQPGVLRYLAQHHAACRAGRAWHRARPDRLRLVRQARYRLLASYPLAISTPSLKVSAQARLISLRRIGGAALANAAKLCIGRSSKPPNRLTRRAFIHTSEFHFPPKRATTSVSGTAIPAFDIRDERS